MHYLDYPDHFVEDAIMQYSVEQIKAGREGTAPIYQRLEKESIQIMRAVAHNKFVAVRSGHGISKSFTCATTALWFMATRPHAKVVITGPKFDQLKITVWAEIGKWLQKSSPDLQYQFRWSAEKMIHIQSPGTWFAQIATSNTPENIAGIHGPHMLIIIDEASGVDNAIFEAILGCLTMEDNHLLCCGNPTRTDGFFRDAFRKDLSRMWKALHFSSEDSAIVSRDWLDMMARKYHVDSDVYRVRVRGEFPKGNPKAIVQFADCETATMREVPPGDFLELGVDPALEGNDLAAIAIRQGYVLHEVRVYPRCNTKELYQYVLRAVRDYRKKTGIESHIAIKVDAGGGYGSDLITSITLNTTDNIEAVPIHSRGKVEKDLEKQYASYAAKMWFGFNDIIGLIQLPNDPDLIDELSGREQRPTDRDAMDVESKGKYKERLGHSPDRADACVLAFDTGPRKVFAKAQTSDDNARTFDIDWEGWRAGDREFRGVSMRNVLHYCALVFSMDTTFVGLCGVYEYFTGLLWLYAEVFHDSPIPDLISKQVQVATRRGTFDDEREPRIIGNSKMFTRDADRRPLADVLVENKLPVLEAVQYDEYGAIALGNQMFADKKIIVHEKLARTRTQVSLWAIEKGKPASRENGYCKALLLMLSELRRQMRHIEESIGKYKSPFSGRYNDYHPVMLGPIEHAQSKHAWMKQ